MARLDYRQKTKLKIWLLAIMLILCVCILSACNNNSGTYDLSNVDNASQIQSMSSSIIESMTVVKDKDNSTFKKFADEYMKTYKKVPACIIIITTKK